MADTYFGMMGDVCVLRRGEGSDDENDEQGRSLATPSRTVACGLHSLSLAQVLLPRTFLKVEFALTRPRSSEQATASEILKLNVLAGHSVI